MQRFDDPLATFRACLFLLSQVDIQAKRQLGDESVCESRIEVLLHPTFSVRNKATLAEAATAK
jgi:hypothetical protein